VDRSADMAGVPKMTNWSVLAFGRLEAMDRAGEE